MIQRVLWGVCLYLLLGVFYLIKTGGVSIESDLSKLFPQSTYNPAVSAFNQRLEAAYSPHVALAIRFDQSADAPRIKHMLTELIAAHSIVELNTAQQQAYLETFYGYSQFRYALLTDEVTELLRAGQFQPFELRARANVMGTASSALSFIDDPFNFAADVQSLVTPNIEGEVDGPFITFQRENGNVILLPLQLQAASFSLTAHDAINQFLSVLNTNLVTQFDAAPEVYVSGLVFHAAEASRAAKQEMQTIGFGSIAGIVLLFVLLFRHLAPLLLSLVSILFGVGAAFLTTHLIFSGVHLITLVFGASLIGIAVDYALHYLCKCQVQSGDQFATNDIVKKVVPALLMGLVTSVLGFSCLVTADLPGLQQVAVFSISGLVFAWVFVVGLFPLMVRSALPLPAPVLSRAVYWLWSQRLTSKVQLVLVVAVVVISVAGASQVSLNNSARALYNPSPELLASEKVVQELANSYALNQYFLVQGRSGDELLAKERVLKTQLQQWRNDGVIDDFRMVSELVPPVDQQQANCKLVQSTLYRAGGPLDNFMQLLGLSDADAGEARSALQQACAETLSIDRWLDLASPLDRVLVLAPERGSPDQYYYSVVMLSGLSATDVVAKYEQAGVEFIDRVAVLSDQLLRLMVEAIELFFLAAVVIMGVLFAYYRHVRGWSLLVLPLSVIALTLSSITLLGIEINLFHILACFLLLGLGMDYSIFAAFGGQDRHTQRAICMSAITSVLSFGLLSLSQTPMIHSFGQALFIGGMCNLLLSPYSPRNIARAGKLNRKA